ncbi:MAG: biotin transporter BioY [Planctomycetota bacterium]
MKNLTPTIDQAFPLAERSAVSAFLWTLCFACLTAVGAKIAVPAPVPLTMQDTFVLLSGVFLGARKGALSQLLYLGAGAAGLPVFALGGGFLYFLGPTGGFLLAFPLAAFVAGLLVHDSGLVRKPSFHLAFLALLLGQTLIYAIGVPWYMASLGVSFERAFQLSVADLLPWAFLKLVLLAAIYREATRRFMTREE